MNTVSLFVRQNTTPSGTAWKPSMLFRAAVIASGVAMAVFMMKTDYAHDESLPVLVGSAVLAAVVLVVLVGRYSLLEKIFDPFHKPSAIVAGILTLTAWWVYFNISLVYWHERPGVVLAAGVLCLLPALFVFLYAFTSRFWSWAWRLIQTSDTGERVVVLAAGVLLSLAIVVLYSRTVLFYGVTGPGLDGVVDVMYTLDSSELVATDAYVNVGAPANDIRHPLFIAFAMPFALCARAMSLPLFFMPNAYPILLAVVHVFLVLCCLVLLARMLKLHGTEKILFLLMATALFPTLLFTINLEKFVLSTFWILVLAEAYCRAKEKSPPLQEKRNVLYLWIAATGSILTSGMFLPLLVSCQAAARGVRGYLNTLVRSTLAAGLVFFVFVTLFGRLPLFTLVGKMFGLTRFTGVDVSLAERWRQFVYFVTTCFVPPAAHVDLSQDYPCYWPDPVTSISIAGLVLLGLVVVGFALNWQNRFARICFGWVVCSFLILCVGGWGTSENGLVLYIFYFSWAYVSLLVLLTRKLFAAARPARLALYAATTVFLLVSSLPELYKIVDFGVTYYPVK